MSVKVLEQLFPGKTRSDPPKNMDTVCLNYIKIPDVISSNLCSPYRGDPMEP